MQETLTVPLNMDVTCDNTAIQAFLFPFLKANNTFFFSFSLRSFNFFLLFLGICFIKKNFLEKYKTQVSMQRIYPNKFQQIIYK